MNIMHYKLNLVSLGYFYRLNYYLFAPWTGILHSLILTIMIATKG